MKKIRTSEITRLVEELCIKANTRLRPDILAALKKACAKEKGKARKMICAILDNAAVARDEELAICQDTGMAEVFLEIGQDVRFLGGDLNKAVEAGVRQAYKKGSFRKSVVDPIRRKNTNTNCPPLVYTRIVPGRDVKVTVAAKGFGCENKSRIKMFLPTVGPQEITDFVKETAVEAGPDACPPFIIGVGIGGTMEKAALLSKEALNRPVDRRNKKRHIARLEKDILSAVNKTGLGPLGLGGRTTALAVNIEVFPTHIAGLPVAVSIGCHATRSACLAI